MSSGAKVVTAYIRELTPGVTPDGPWNLITRTSFGVGPTYNTTENNEIGEDRMSQGSTQTTVDVGGDVVTKMRFQALDNFFASCFGSEWSSDNTLTMGNSRITFSLGYYASDVGIAGKATGAQVTTMALSVPNDGEIEVTTTFGATGWTDKADDSSYIESIIKERFDRRYSFVNVRNLKLNGVQVGENNMCVDTFNLQFDNSAQTQRCIGNGNPFAGNIIATKFTPSGSITLSWAKAAYELWKKQQTNSAISFEFELYNEDGFYTFSIPEMEVSGSWPDGGAEDIIQVELTFTARRTPPVITRQAPEAESISISLPSTSLEKNTTMQATSRVIPVGASQAVTWSSSDDSVVTVNAYGIVRGQDVGTAEIIATASNSPGVTGSVQVSVTDIEPDSISVTFDRDIIEVGETAKATAQVEPTGAPQGVYWSTSDPDIASIDDDGQVQGNAVGTANITATSMADESVFFEAQITIKRQSPKSISIDLESPTIDIGNTTKVTAKVSPSEAVQSVTWSSTDVSIFTVDNDGTITGQGVGTASVTATSTEIESISASTQLSVTRPAPQSISVSLDSNAIKSGDETSATASVSPGAADQAVTWSSSNPEIATVSQSGLVSGVSVGSASITATSNSQQSVSGSQTVTVERPDPSGISVSIDNDSIEVGKTSQATATVSPDGADQAVSWSSSDTEVATVDDSGLVTAQAAGSAKITAKSSADSSLNGDVSVTVTEASSASVVAPASAPIKRTRTKKTQ